MLAPSSIDRSIYMACTEMVAWWALWCRRRHSRKTPRRQVEDRQVLWLQPCKLIKRTVADVSQAGQVGSGATIRVAKGNVSKVLKTVEGDGGQQWTCDDYRTRTLVRWSRPRT